jgi:extradiol dioxygenase family protein
MTLPPFHLAFPVHDLAAARDFYGRLLGCPEGRSSDLWVDFDLRGHQIVAHLSPGARREEATNPVDGEEVPVPHFGLVLPMRDWEALAERLVEAGVRFIIPPTVRFAGLPGEQATMFLLDPSGNAIEFKAMADPTKLFATA